MPDPRFFASGREATLAALVEMTGAELVCGDPASTVTQAAPLARATAASVTYLSDARHLDGLRATRAGAVFISDKHRDAVPAGCAVLVIRHPQAAWAQAAAFLHPLIEIGADDPAVHPDASLEPGVRLGRHVVVGAGAQIGSGTVIEAGAWIGPGVAIGRNCRIGPGASVRCALLGDGVTLLAGARIGEAGFSVADGPRGPLDVPQLGRAILQDRVSVGANSCIDRGGFDDTVIGENTRIDNLVHVGHNVTVGRNCRMAAFTGISGSVVIGDGVLFGGKAGVADWVTIGDGAAIGASASVFKDVPAKEVWTGFPARPMRRWLREQAMLARLVKPGRGGRNEHD